MYRRFFARRAWLAAFVYALLISMLVFLPFVIMDKGLFFYYGDFNVQQIPFYQLAHRAVRSGNLGWNWFTDLGVNFVGSYSFYNLFSPFFWLTLPFPTAATPYLMAPLLILKTACAAATGCLYVGRFTRHSRFAVFGGLLYAFSGFATYNIFFNHFHEVIVFFPLLLYALERLLCDGKRGLFAAMVAVNCVVNYWFFIGTVVFTILYFIVRTASGGWEMSWKKFFTIALEALMGVLLACFALLPSVLAIMGNPRTTSDNLLTGWGFWLYGHEQRIPAILESIFFPPDIPSRPNFFPDHGAKWASLSAWLPMIGPSFVLAYCMSTAKSWMKRLLYLCLCLALVPGLNSLFVLLNNSYYARWFYMPILLMAVCSALALERFCIAPESCNLQRGLLWTAGITGLYIIAVGLTPVVENEKVSFGLMEYPDRFWIYCAITVLGLLSTWLIVRYMQGHPRFMRTMGLSLGCICVLYSITMIAMGRMHSNDRDWMRTIALDGARELALPQEEGRFDRSDIYDNMDNLGMFWGLPNIQAFHSIVPVSLMEFYPSVGVKRDVSSKPQPENYALRSLLSVRWLFVAEDVEKDKQPSTPYFTLWDNQLGFHIYENNHYLPMGLGYTQYITREDFETVTAEERAKLLHKAVLVEEEDLKNVRRIIDPLPEKQMRDLSEAQYLEDVEERSDMAADFFSKDKDGFTSRGTYRNDCILFFSVPFEKGWSAQVNGTPTKAIQVQGGFLGVPVDRGYNEVRFTYATPGLKAGALISTAGLLLLAGYLILMRRRPLCGPPPSPWITFPDCPLDGPFPVLEGPVDEAVPAEEPATEAADTPDEQDDAEEEEEEEEEEASPFVWQGEEPPLPADEEEEAT